MGILETLAISLGTGLASSLATIAALKTEVRWIRKVQEDQEGRLRHLEHLIANKAQHVINK
ncbi:hypothetical protein BCT30_08015 [Enterovibrio norvegicus]|nr:hypothetical protein BCU47_06635 [Enterovibrio norvegicus]PMI40705.1 hypothetical protein BCU46_04710 [Enterovibrio norvegicus]PMN56389.1 hypothetical protein BCT30_08015 [Enterovibrio norvegicus]TKF09323.1 hypothetical protein FCV66_21750 [Enterovibrio norvegicus]TKF35111.1 hypothetical protein FCV83_05235 [Enterovibrio norvegicus]